jgi:ribosomal protein S18 acetylase RimI-like enzyme
MASWPISTKMAAYIQKVGLPKVIKCKAGQSFVVRPLTRQDAPALQAFGNGLTPETVNNFEPHAYDFATLDFMLTRAETGDDASICVEEENEHGRKIVGYASVWYANSPTAAFAIGFADGYQGRGLGSQIFDLLIEISKACGCSAVDLTCMPDNKVALDLYKSRGFVEYGMVPTTFGDNQQDIERGLMLELGPGAKRLEVHMAPCLLR